jgi:hypothetical protein
MPTGAQSQNVLASALFSKGQNIKRKKKEPRLSRQGTLGSQSKRSSYNKGHQDNKSIMIDITCLEFAEFFCQPINCF